MHHNPQKLDVKGPWYFLFTGTSGDNYLLNRSSQAIVCRIIQEMCSKG